MFSCEFCKIFKDTYFVKHLRTASSQRLWCNKVLPYPYSIEIWKNLIKRTRFIKTFCFLVLECSFQLNDNFLNGMLFRDFFVTKQLYRAVGGGGGGGLSKSVGCHGWLTSKNWKQKKTWLKRPKAVPQQSPKKQNLDQNINASKSQISNHFFENIFSSIQLFYIRPHVPADIIRVSFQFQII